ncbi:MMPL family transporter [Streptomyces sp. B6B3]|uniref:MMPL family transporter n=1 Tax=Streptomyces sp. B6B3 TaxID=3153570 RepID=UPI00325FAB39
MLVGALIAAVQLTGGANYQEAFAFPESDSQTAQAVVKRDFPQAAGDVNRIVFHTTTGTVSDPSVRERVQPMLKKVASLPHVDSVASPYGTHSPSISRDGKTAFATVTFDAAASDLPEPAVSELIDTAQSARSSTLQVELGGQAVAGVESSGPGPLMAIGLGASALVLLLLFGSLTAMALPLVTVLVALGAGYSVAGLLTHVMSLGSSAEGIASMIALGVGVDYSLFIVSRFRSLLAEGRTPEEAAVGSMNTAGRAVLFAGSIVVLALLVLLMFGVSVTSGIAVVSAIEVFFTMAAALTLLPAVLSLLGHRVNSLRVPGRRLVGGTTISPRHRRWAEMVRRRRWIAAAGVTVVLLILTLPVLSLRQGNPDAGTNPPQATTRQAYDLLSDGFGPGFNGPLQLVATLPSSSDAPTIEHLASAVRSEPGVASVSPPRTNPAGTTAVLSVVPTTSPQDEATSDLVHRLRDTVIPRATGDSGVAVHVGGPTASFIDLSSLLSSRLLPFVAVVLVIGFVLLLVVFRSLAIALTAALLNLLSIGAALGVVSFVFEHGLTGLPDSPVSFAVPVMMIAIVFGLSTDYQVFLLSRVQEEWHTHRDNDRAVRDGMGRVSGIITGAAVIMIAVFGAFALGGQLLFEQIGIGFAVAVALDAFLIRFILVPAVMYILGERNWKLPRWLRWLPQLHIEAEEPHDTTPAKQPSLEEVRTGGHS